MSFFNKKFMVKIVFFWVLVISLSLFSVNCSMDKEIESQFSSSEDDNSDTTNDQNTNNDNNDTSDDEGSDTEDSSDTEVSDFAWSKVTWLRDQDVSGWEESSQITSVEVRSNGSICIDYTERGQWPVRHPQEDGDVAVDGNPWVIVKLDGQYYASTYEWLRPVNFVN